MKRLLLPLALLIAGCASQGGSAAGEHSTAAIPRHKTGRTLDLAIDGDGYFIVQTSAGGFLFTRSGDMVVASNGEMTNADGYRLYPPITVPANSENVVITPDGAVRRDVVANVPELIGQIVLSRFTNADKLEKDGIYCMPTESSGEPITGRPGTKGLGAIRTGEIED